MTPEGFRWVRVTVHCPDCGVTFDYPALIPETKRVSATVIHGDRRHYVDQEVRPN